MASIVGERYKYATAGDTVPPPGYIYIAAEGDNRVFSAPTNVAFGANGSFYYKSGVAGPITFNTATFGDPIRNVVKSGFAEPTDTNIDELTGMVPVSKTTTIIKWVIYGGLALTVIIVAVVLLRRKKNR